VSTKVYLFESVPALTTALIAPQKKKHPGFNTQTPQQPLRTCAQKNYPGTFAPHPAPTLIGCKFLKSKPAAEAVGQRGGII